MEAAIVLGVFGIILGGIWGVVGPVREDIRRSQAVQEITTTVNNIRAQYQGRANISGTSAVLTDALLRSGAISNEMIRFRTAATLIADNPWGQSAADGSALPNGGFVVSENLAGDIISSNAAGIGPSFRIELLGLGRASCIAMATKITNQSGPPGLLGVRINGAAYAASAALPTVSAAQGNCNNNSTVGYVFRLRQQGT